MINERKHMFLITYRDPITFKPVEKKIKLKFIGDTQEIRVYFDSTKFARFITKDKNWTETLSRARLYTIKKFTPGTSCPTKINITYGWQN